MTIPRGVEPWAAWESKDVEEVRSFTNPGAIRVRMALQTHWKVGDGDRIVLTRLACGSRRSCHAL